MWASAFCVCARSSVSLFLIHAQTVHGEKDTPELREMTRKSLKLESSLNRAA